MTGAFPAPPPPHNTEYFHYWTCKSSSGAPRPAACSGGVVLRAVVGAAYLIQPGAAVSIRSTNG